MSVEWSRIHYFKGQLDQIKFVAFDFDGVFTDNRVIVSETGEESVICNRSDGIGLERLRQINIPFAVFSTEVNPVVAARCEKLKIPCYSGLSGLSGRKDKLTCLTHVIAEKGISLKQVAFIGNDINDLPCFRAVGFPIAVADAWIEVRQEALLVLTRAGGLGSVREFCDLLFYSKKNISESMEFTLR